MFLKSVLRTISLLRPVARTYLGPNLLGGFRFNSSKSSIFTLDLNLASTEGNDLAKNENENNKKDDLSDILADMVFEPSGSESSELDRIFADLAKGTNVLTSDEYNSVTLDQTDEDIFEQESKKSDIINEEKRLFENIFDTYVRKDRETPSSNKLESEVLWNLQQSFTNNNRHWEEKPVSHEPLPTLAIKKCLEKAKIALKPTLDQLLAMEKQLDLVLFLTSVLDRYNLKDYDELSFYMHKLNYESTEEFLARMEELFSHANAACELDPFKPYLHEHTMPVIFNHILRLLSNKFYNGQLALSLFNSIKKDLNLYTIMCNQDTYNEMLKVYWIYMGKSSLCEIELLIVEMMNNGFRGDLATFTILKEVVGEYHTMRMGKSLYNPGGVPIWSLEDEKRATKLGEKLRELGKYLRQSSHA